MQVLPGHPEKDMSMQHSACMAPSPDAGARGEPSLLAAALGEARKGPDLHEREREKYYTYPATQGRCRCCQDVPWQVPNDGTVCISTKKGKPMSR